MPPVALSIMQTTVGFLLVMRTGEGSKRWWEGRASFGTFQALCVDLVRQITAGCDNEPLAKSTGLHALAAVVTLKNQLLTVPENDKEELGQFLPPVAVDAIVGHDSMTRQEILQVKAAVLSRT